MLPKRSDTRTANMATHSFIDEMVKAGVKVYFYKPGFLHSKLMVADDELTCIGSANMDFRSFEHNFEINAFVYQPSFAQQMRKVFLLAETPAQTTYSRIVYASVFSSSLIKMEKFTEP